MQKNCQPSEEREAKTEKTKQNKKEKKWKGLFSGSQRKIWNLWGIVYFSPLTVKKGKLQFFPMWGQLDVGRAERGGRPFGGVD